MAAPGRLVQLGPPLIAVAIAALWPLSAYAVGPLALPATLALGALALLVVKRPEWGIAAILATTPLYHLTIGLPGPTGDVFPSRPLTVIFPIVSALILTYGLLFARGRWQGVEARRLLVALLFFVAVLLISTAYALDPGASLSKVSLLMTAAMLFLAVIQICERRSQLMVVIAGALIGLLAASMQGVVQHYADSFGSGFASSGVGSFVVGRVQGSFDHPNQFAGYLASLMPLAAVMALGREFPRALRRLSLLAFVLAVPALMFSYARGSIIAAVLGAIVWLAVVRPRAAAAVAVIVTVSAIVLAPGTLKERFNPEASQSDFIERVDLWNAAIEMYEEHPLLGVGVNNYPVAYPNLPKTPSVAPERRLFLGEETQIPPHAHNLYLNTLAEQGILGSLALFVLIVVMISTVYRGCQVADPGDRMICTGIGIGLLTLLANSLVQVTLFTEAVVALFGLVGVATVLAGLAPAPATFPRSPVGARAGSRLTHV